MENKIDIFCNCNTDNFCIHSWFNMLITYINKYDDLQEPITKDLILYYYQRFPGIQEIIRSCQSKYPNTIFHDLQKLAEHINHHRRFL